MSNPSLVPPSSAIPTADDKQQRDDGDDKKGVVHIVLLRGATPPLANPGTAPRTDHSYCARTSWNSGIKDPVSPADTTGVYFFWRVMRDPSHDTPWWPASLLLQTSGAGFLAL